MDPTTRIAVTGANPKFPKEKESYRPTKKATEHLPGPVGAKTREELDKNNNRLKGDLTESIDSKDRQERELIPTVHPNEIRVVQQQAVEPNQPIQELAEGQQQEAVELTQGTPEVREAQNLPSGSIRGGISIPLENPNMPIKSIFSTQIAWVWILTGLMLIAIGFFPLKKIFKKIKSKIKKN